MLFQCPMWLAGGSTYLTRALTYSFFHANIFHLAVNCLSVWVVFRPGMKGNLAKLIAGYLIAVLVYAVAPGPIVGFSNVLYAICGLSAKPFSNRLYWLNPNTLTFIGVMMLMLLLPHFSASTHISAYILGLMLMHIKSALFDSLTKYAGRYTRS